MIEPKDNELYCATTPQFHGFGESNGDLPFGRKQHRLSELIRGPNPPQAYQIYFEINEALRQNGHQEEFDDNDLVVTDQCIHEFDTRNPPLSNLIYQHSFPAIPSRRVAHYTSLDSFKSIVSSGTLRLHSLRERRSKGGELEPFLTLCGYDEGQVDPTTGEPAYSKIYKEMAEDLFYTSFTTSPDEDLMWNEFGDSHQGVRLDFEVVPGRAEFRDMLYSESRLKLLKDILQIARSHGKTYLFRGVSRGAAFFLSHYYKECESRLLLSRTAGRYPFTLTIVKGERRDYVSLPVAIEQRDVGANVPNENDYARISLVGIQPGRMCARSAFDRTVTEAGLADLVVP